MKPCLWILHAVLLRAAFYGAAFSRNSSAGTTRVLSPTTKSSLARERSRRTLSAMGMQSAASARARQPTHNRTMAISLDSDMSTDNVEHGTPAVEYLRALMARTKQRQDEFAGRAVRDYMHAGHCRQAVAVGG